MDQHVHGAVTHSSGSNMFFSSRHCVGMGEAGPSTPCNQYVRCQPLCVIAISGSLPPMKLSI